MKKFREDFSILDELKNGQYITLEVGTNGKEEVSVCTQE